MRINVRWWLTAGCDWPSNSHNADTCISPSRASANKILRRERSARSLKISLRLWIVPSDTLIVEGEPLAAAFWPRALPLIVVVFNAQPSENDLGERPDAPTEDPLPDHGGSGTRQPDAV